MAKVYLAEPVFKFDLKPLERYGSLDFLREDLDIFSPTLSVHKLINSLIDKDFNFEKDYICLTGNSVILSLLTVAVMSITDKVKLLIFDARCSQYTERILERTPHEDYRVNRTCS